MLSSFVAGLGLGLSLIVAIGAQNLFVLRQGIRREHVLAVVVVCAASDAVLIALGVSGLGLLLTTVPWLVEAVRWAGAAFLVVYGILAARRAWRPSGEALAVRGAEDAPAPPTPGSPPSGNALAPVLPGAAAPASPPADATATAVRPPRLIPVLLTCLALTWLNPHVYLDTVFLLGGVANTHGDARWLFAAGAMLGSILWFTALGFGARVLGRRLSTPGAWRVLDALIAIVMIAIAVSLVLPS